MKIIARVTLVGDDRKAIPPGGTLDLPDDEAQSLVDRRLADLPSSDKPSKKSASTKADNA